MQLEKVEIMSFEYGVEISFSQFRWFHCTSGSSDLTKLKTQTH